MRRLLGAMILLSALALGLCWLAKAPERTGRARASVGVAERAAWGPRQPSGPVLDEPPAADGATLRDALAAAAGGRTPLFASHEEELAQAHWIEGRVIPSAGLPADEAAFVVADGREFSDGTLHRARVAPDGSFRVAFSPGAKAGWIGLEGRYLYLPTRTRWTLASGGSELALAPVLGGRVVGRLLAPPGSSAPSFRGEVELSNTPNPHLRAQAAGNEELRLELGGELDPGTVPGHEWQRCAPLGRDGEFVFEALPVGNGLVLEYRGASWLGRSEPFALAAGRTERCELALVAGVVLGGKVRDERGRGIADALVRVARSSVETRTGRDGSFRLPALEAGERELLVSCDGYLPARKALGKFELGTRRTDLALVLARGAAIGGSVLGPDGSPAEATVRLEPEEADTPGPRSLVFHSASDGRFLAQGLFPGSYRVHARKKARPDVGKLEASLAHVRAGTTGLELRLADE